MSYSGTIKRVYDNTSKKGTPYWTVVIHTDQKGEVKFNLFDCVYAGQTSKNHEAPLCDVHSLVEQRVVFDVEQGAVKAEATGERWPSTLTMVSPSVAPPIGSLLADEARSPGVEAHMAIAEHLEAIQRHLGAALEIVRKS